MIAETKVAKLVGLLRGESNLSEVATLEIQKLLLGVDGTGTDETKPGIASSDEILRCLDSNEDGDASLFTGLFRGQFVYDHASATWYTWVGHHWVEDRINEATAAVGAVIDAYGEEAKRQAWQRLKCEKGKASKEAKEHARLEENLLKRIRLLQTAARKNNILALARVGLGGLGITGQEWDLDSWLIGCTNGVIDLRTGECRPGRPDDFIKTVAPTTWTGLETLAPTWEHFLDVVFEEQEEIIGFLQRAMGYAITGLTSWHGLLIMWGAGRNGKSTFLETLGHVLGPLAGQIEAELLLAHAGPRRSGGPTSDIMTLKGKRLVWASETSEGRRLNAGKLKWLTGGDSLCGREVFGRHQVSFQPTHKLILLTNAKPRANAADYALWQRLHLIPFTLSFVDEPKAEHERVADLSLPEKLKAEASGILAWLVKGCLAWQKEGLKPPTVVKAATERYRSEEDLVAQFLSEACEVNAMFSAATKELYSAYLTWSEANGLQKMSLKRLSKELVDRGFERVDTGRTVYFQGISAREGE